jgi:hypothetical protein
MVKGGGIERVEGNLLFELVAKGGRTFIGRVLGHESDFELNVTIGRENGQEFRIERISPSGETRLLAQGEMQYGKRNMPHASGIWENASQTFSLVVLSSWHCDLSIYRKNDGTVEVLRLEKAPDPERPSIWAAVLPTLVVGGLIVGLRLWDTHQYIAFTEEAEKAQAEMQEKKAKEDKPGQSGGGKRKSD